jgi:RHS repeat-associated protein
VRQRNFSLEEINLPTSIVLLSGGVGGLPVAAVTPAVDGATLTAVYYHHDVMGSTVAVTQGGDSGASEAYTYSDFGAPGAGTWATYRYAGYRYDSETGLYYVNARYYNPNLGRFLQTDPIGLQGGTNLYAYVGNDPINLIDSSGHCAELPSQQQTSAIFGNTTPNVVPAAPLPASVQLLGQTDSLSGPAPGWMNQPGTTVAANVYSYQVIDANGVPVSGTDFTTSETITPIVGNGGSDILQKNTALGGSFVDVIGFISNPGAPLQGGQVYNQQLQTFNVTFTSGANSGVSYSLSTVVQQSAWMLNGTLMQGYPTIIRQ